MQNYRQLAEQLNQLKNPETNEFLVDEMENLLRRIISKRTAKKFAPKYPEEEGDYLVDPTQVVVSGMAGNFKPKVWESVEIKEKKADQFGEVEISLVCDGSGSMEGEKSQEQLKAAVLFMETLKRFADVAEEEKINMDKLLTFRSEVLRFFGNSSDTLLKSMSEDFSETDRIKSATKIIQTSRDSSNGDNNLLQKMNNSFTHETIEKIKTGELKKIIIVMTDGEADYIGDMQNIVSNIRQQGIVVIGVGITQDGASALETYKVNPTALPEGKTPEETGGAVLAKSAADLPKVLAEILQKNLKNL